MRRNLLDHQHINIIILDIYRQYIDSQDKESNKKPRLEPEQSQSGKGKSEESCIKNNEWCTRQGSNLRPSVSKTGTLPAELRVHTT